MESTALIAWMLTVSRYFLFAGIPFLIFYILFPKFFFNNKIQVKLARRKDFLREIGHSLQSTLILTAIGLLFFKTPQVYHNTADYALWWIPVSVVLALILHDTYFYWLH